MPAVQGMVSYQIIDGNKVPYNLPFHVLAGSGLLADIELAQLALTPLVDAVTEGQITKIHYTVDVAVPGGVKTAPVGDSNNSVGALVNLSDVNTPIPGNESIYIPAWIRSGFQTTHRNQVDQSNAAYLAFIAGLKATVNTVTVTTEDFIFFNNVLRANKSNRTNRRALGRAR